MHAAFVRQRAVATAVATSSLRAAWQRCGGGGCGALTGTNSGGLGTAGRHSQHPRHPPNCGGGACGRARASLGGGGSGGVQLTRNNNNGRRKLVAAASASGDDGAVGGTGGDGGGSEQQWTRSVTSLSVGKTPKAGKQRLDELTIERHPEFSRTVVQSWIAQGKVLVDGQPIWANGGHYEGTKAGTRVKSTVKISIIAENPKFVCRGGLKLEKALEEFDVDVEGKVALDSGLSTGGFTDCLLQCGAVKVYGVDVGYGQVAEKVRVDPRVVVMERTNLRYLQPLPELVDLATLDLSFISVLKLVVLIKPQFEASRGQIGAKGVVRDTKVHLEVIEKVIAGAGEMGFEYVRHTTSPIKGAKEGNTEFLALFNRTALEMPWPAPPPENAAAAPP